MIGEFPGLAKLDERRQPARDVRLPRRSTAALLEQWLGTDAEAIIPGAAQVRAAEDPQVIAARASCSLDARRRPRPPACRSAPTSSARALARSRSRRARRSSQLVNYGEDEHDLRLRRVGGTRTYRIGTGRSRPRRRARDALPPRPLPASGARSPTTAPADERDAARQEVLDPLKKKKNHRTYRVGTVAPGRVSELEARFLPGRFRLWCGIADHRARGMRATLLVKKA